MSRFRHRWTEFVPIKCHWQPSTTIWKTQFHRWSDVHELIWARNWMLAHRRPALSEQRLRWARVASENANISILRIHRMNSHQIFHILCFLVSHTVCQLKVVTRRQEVEPVTQAASMLKWTKLNDESASSSLNSTASLRAKASKVRLQELESDICDRSEKQLAREKRSAQLKQFLVDSDIETYSRADRR